MLLMALLLIFPGGIANAQFPLLFLPNGDAGEFADVGGQITAVADGAVVRVSSGNESMLFLADGQLSQNVAFCAGHKISGCTDFAEVYVKGPEGLMLAGNLSITAPETSGSPEAVLLPATDGASLSGWLPPHWPAVASVIVVFALTVSSVLSRRRY